MGQAQSRVAGDTAASIEDLGDAVGRHLELPREFGGAHPQLAELRGQMFPGMYCSYCHGMLLMVINNFYVRRTGRTVSPLKANPPLVINADTVLSFSISL